MRSRRSLKVSHTQRSVPCGTLHYVLGEVNKLFGYLVQDQNFLPMNFILLLTREYIFWCAKKKLLPKMDHLKIILNRRYYEQKYRIFCNKRPHPINPPTPTPPPPTPPSLLYLCKVYISGFRASQQPTLLRFRDSEKWCILVLPKRISLTRNKENKNKTWQFWSQTH